MSSEVQVPSEFVCPITKDIMTHPSSTVDGQTYEDEAIKHWFAAGHISSPLTGLPLGSSTLTPNIALRQAIESFLEQRPQMEAQAREVGDLQACLQVRERELQAAVAMNSKTSPPGITPRELTVPRVEYERVLAQLRLLGRKRTHFQMAGIDASVSACVTTAAPLAVSDPAPTPDAGSADASLRDEPHAALIPVRLEALHGQRAAMEETRACTAGDLEVCEVDAAACTRDLVAFEAAAVSHELKVEVQRAKASKLHQHLCTKQAELDRKGEELISHAELLGIDGAEMLVRIRHDSSVHWKGELPSMYAQLHCECIALRSEEQHAHDAASAAGNTAAVQRTHASATKAKELALRESLVGLRAQVAAAETGLASLTQSIDQVRANSSDLQMAAAWVQRVSDGALTPTPDNLLMLSAVHQQHQSTSGLATGAALSELRARGRAAKDLRKIGFSLRELNDAGYSLGELKQDVGCSAAEFKEAGYSTAALKQAGLCAAELKEIGCSTVELKQAGYSAAELKEIGCSTVELKQAGCSAAELKEVGCCAVELRQAGYAARDLYHLCAAIDVCEEGLAIVTMSGFGNLRARDGDKMYPWEAAGLWRDALNNDQVWFMARSLHW